MAGFTVQGLDELALSLREIAEIPDNVRDEMLNAGADVLVPIQRKKILQYGIYDKDSTKHVADSIKKSKVKSTRDGSRVIYVSPTGSRMRGNKRTRNAEILFVNEFGKRGVKARPAVKEANEEAADAIAKAKFDVYDKWLKSKNL